MSQATDMASPHSAVSGMAEAARNAMVDSQVRPNKVTDPGLIAAMRMLPRENFLSQALQARAYADEDVRLAEGRVLVSPMITARLLQLAAVRAGEHVLMVGAGTGYTAALLAACGARVVALEQDKALLAIAGPALAAWAPNVQLVEGALQAGWTSAAPYDLVMIDGAVEALPDAIAAQVAPSGRLIMVRSSPGDVARAVTGRPGPGGLSFAAAFDCTVATLPAMRRAPEFVF